MQTMDVQLSYELSCFILTVFRKFHFNEKKKQTKKKKTTTKKKKKKKTGHGDFAGRDSY